VNQLSNPRTPAQAAASRANGSKSLGPRTAPGKAASSANALTSGLYCRTLLGPGGNVDAIRAEFNAWIDGYGVRSSAAHQLAARGAYTTVQLDRVEAIRERALGEVLAQCIAESEPAKALERARKVRTEVAGLASLTGEIQAPVPRGHAAKLLPPLRVLALDVLNVPAALAASYAIGATINIIEVDTIDDVPAEVFGALAASCGEILAAIDGAIPEMETKVEAERAHQEEYLIFATDRRLKEVDRVRIKLIKEIEALARALAAVRDLEHCPSGESRAGPTDLPPFEFKVVGGLANR
jgi:hypothetical protein